MGMNDIDHTIYPYTVGRIAKFYRDRLSCWRKRKHISLSRTRVRWSAASSISMVRRRAGSVLHTVDGV